MNSSLLAVVIAVAVAYILTPVVRRVATHWGVVAHPGGRRVHTVPTPLMGGLAMYVAFVVAVVVVVALRKDLSFESQTVGILVGATMLAAVGLLDDKYELPGWVQALAIIGSGGVLIGFGVEILYVTNPFKGGHLLPLGNLVIPLTLLWVLVVTKAVDCMDGLDGLAAGICAIASATLMLMALKAGHRFEMSAVMSAALMGSALGFLRFNYPPAKVFMGTIGAQFLGFTLAGISIAGAFKRPHLVAVAAAILSLAVPLLDTRFVVLRRAARGKKMHEGDTSHLHHRLVDKGLSHRQTIWVIYGLTIVLCATAYLLFTSVKLH